MKPTATRSGVRALVVDDEPVTADLVTNHLADQGFDVSRSMTGEDALVAALVVDPDVVVVKVQLPGIDGVELCRRLRLFSDCYVLMIKAAPGEVDVLLGLSAGADDVMTEPLRVRELVARIRAVTRRPRALCEDMPCLSPERRTIGALTIDHPGREIWLDDALVPLTRTEFDLLATLAGHPDLTFTRQALVEAVRGERDACDEHVVDVHIGHVRRKLEDSATSQRFIRTVRGIGYRIGPGE